MFSTIIQQMQLHQSIYSSIDYQSKINFLTLRNSIRIQDLRCYSLLMTKTDILHDESHKEYFAVIIRRLLYAYLYFCTFAVLEVVNPFSVGR